MSSQKHIVVIGSGVAGLAAAVRLSAAGFKVTVVEANSYVGGKLTSQDLGAYRFDMGPSVFTLPELIDELTAVSGIHQPFQYISLPSICNYFYEDGTRLKAYPDKEKFAAEVAEKLGESKESVYKQLRFSGLLYTMLSDIFMRQSLHKLSNFLNLKTAKAILNIGKFKMNKTMNEVNSANFKNPKTVQLFNRFATYNGSDPYQAPAIINIIAHLEHNIGAFAPVGGMHDITKHLHSLSVQLGAEYKLNTRVSKILLDGNTVVGVATSQGDIKADMIVSDADIKHVYGKLLDPHHSPRKILEQEKSLSALIFYWGIKKEFKELGLHNILFSGNGEAEFRCVFRDKKPYHDPTTYINITSKVTPTDAPAGCENWFVMVNVPHNASGKPIEYVQEMRKHIVAKINRVLNTDIEQYIEVEDVQDPYLIEQRTSSAGGSLYGNASNNKYAAFLRHANFSSRIKNLYFCGGSVHPGGGIPLGLLSAKIVSDMIREKEGKA
ncbi:MAG: phytoene desaturase [Bacteroidetes bacterium]|nr:phytoene desaturase [Bacteroidota bacterium]